VLSDFPVLSVLLRKGLRKTQQKHFGRLAVARRGCAESGNPASSDSQALWESPQDFSIERLFHSRRAPESFISIK
jgi:hypothetical protein